METGSLIHIDTNVVIWSYVGRTDILQSVEMLLRESEVVASPAVVLELGYLHEVGRMADHPETVVQTLDGLFGLKVSQTSFADVIRQALTQRWTRDPFDRLIVANALADGARLLTKDANILQNCPSAFWM